MGYTPIVSYESTRVKSKTLKRNKKGPRVETRGPDCDLAKGKEKLGHDKSRWHTLIDIPRGILLDLIAGPTAFCDPGTVNIEVQQVGPWLDLRNGIVSHGGISIVIRYDQYKTSDDLSQEFFGRGLIPGSAVVG